MNEVKKQTPDDLMRELTGTMSRACEDLKRELDKALASWDKVKDLFGFLYSLKNRGDIIHAEVLRHRGIHPKREDDRHVDNGV